MKKKLNYIDFVFYLVAILAVMLVKIYYENASNEQLLFILKPLSKIISLFYNTNFYFESDLGFVNIPMGIVISKSCAGINYMLIVFSMLCFTYIHTISKVKWKIMYILLLIPITYIFSLLINSFRIIVSIVVNSVSFLEGTISSEVLHNLTGMLIFICFLFILNYFASTILKKDVSTYE